MRGILPAAVMVVMLAALLGGVALAAAPTAPTGLTATAMNQAAFLSWTAPSGVTPAISGYDVGREYPAYDSGTQNIVQHDKSSTAAVTLPTLASNDAIEVITPTWGGTLYRLKRDTSSLQINVSNFAVGGNTQCVRYSDTLPASKTNGTQFSGGTCGWTTFTWSNQSFTANMTKTNQPQSRYYWLDGGDPGNIGGGSSTLRVQAAAGYGWASTGSTATTHTVTGLTNASAEKFKVRAVNSDGAGTASDSVNVTPSASALPSRPGSLSATAGDASVTLAWTAATPTQTIARYEYQVRIHNPGNARNTDWSVFASAGLVTSVVVTRWPGASPVDFVNGETYRFRVRACDTAGSCGPTAPDGSPNYVSAVTAAPLPTPTPTPTPTPPPVQNLGSVVIEVGSSGDNYGFTSSYGSLVSGSFPGRLFGNGNSRTVAEIYEDADGKWSFVYSGGDADDWASDEELNSIQVRVLYHDSSDAPTDINTREFVLGGFVEEREGNHTLKLAPPLPSTRDWDGESGREVELEFSRTWQAAAVLPGIALAEPVTGEGTFARFVDDTTPGGAIIAQNLIVLTVYFFWAFKGIKMSSSLLLGGAILVLTPWIPVIFAFGSVHAAAINLVNILLGAFVYKYFFSAREQYQ